MYAQFDFRTKYAFTINIKMLTKQLQMHTYNTKILAHSFFSKTRKYRTKELNLVQYRNYLNICFLLMNIPQWCRKFCKFKCTLAFYYQIGDDFFLVFLNRNYIWEKDLYDWCNITYIVIKMDFSLYHYYYLWGCFTALWYLWNELHCKAHKTQ